MKLQNVWGSFSYSVPEHFVQSQWQKGARSLVFLIYRWIFALAFIGIVINSIRTYAENGSLRYYMIFLTQWCLIFNLVTSVMGAILATYWHFHGKPKCNLEIESEMSWLYKFYWFTHTVSVVLSIVLSVNFWALAYKGQDLRVDSYLKHGMNSILMILDVFISKHEMKVSHFVHPVFVSFIYNVFNFVYFLLGGFNDDGEPFIYAVLNWENPLKSTIVMAGSLILMCVVYFLVFLMQKGRTKVFNKYFVEEMKSIV